jgi:hypothetical protein
MSQIVRKTFIKDFCVSTVLLDKHGSYKTNYKRLGCEFCKYQIPHDHGLYENVIFKTKNNKILKRSYEYVKRMKTREEAIEWHDGIVDLYEDKIFLKVKYSGEKI